MHTSDRVVILDDEKKRLLDLTAFKFVPPSEGIYEGEVRYYAANLKWAKLIEGFVSWLATVAAWPDANDENYQAIQEILTFLEGIDLPTSDFDCEDVENCLETSTIIINLITQINNLNTQITELQEQLEEIEHEQEAGNPLPDNPDMADSGNAVCRGANFIAERLSDRLLEYWEQASTLSLEEFVNALLNIATIGFIPATAFWQFVFTLSDPDLADEAVTKTDRIALAFFCANWDMELAKSYINADSSLTENEKALWIVTIELYRQGQFDEWGLVGTLGTTEYNCSEGCPWVVVWDFAGDYVPIGDEDAIYEGNKWNVSGGTFVAGTGYVAFADVMVVSKELPEQCALHHYYMQTARGDLCLASDQSVWWRGIDGQQVEQYSPEGRQIQQFYTEQHFTVLGEPIMTEARIKMDAFFCGSSPTYGQKIRYVRLIGSGVMPQE